jgi:hypothetical protein
MVRDDAINHDPPLWCNDVIIRHCVNTSDEVHIDDKVDARVDVIVSGLQPNLATIKTFISVHLLSPSWYQSTGSAGPELTPAKSSNGDQCSILRPFLLSSRVLSAMHTVDRP